MKINESNEKKMKIMKKVKFSMKEVTFPMVKTVLADSFNLYLLRSIFLLLIEMKFCPYFSA